MTLFDDILTQFFPDVQATVRWFETGEKLSTETFKKLTRRMIAYLLDSIKSLGKRKPGQKGLRERITQSWKVHHWPKAAECSTVKRVSKISLGK